MTITPHTPADPPENNESGDAWVNAADGGRYWGRYGAAGVLAYDPQRGLLLQHRSPRTADGDTWGIPGGARHRSESALQAALREAREESGIDPASLTPLCAHRIDTGGWHYTTIIALAAERASASPLDWESLEFRWVPAAQLPTYKLHPEFAKSLPQLLPLLQNRYALVVDAANVVGATPNGWWRDRAAATDRILQRIAGHAHIGYSASLYNEALPGIARYYPHTVVVTEGQARAAATPAGLTVTPAAGSGDDEIADQTVALVSAGYRVAVITSDAGLKNRVQELGATVHGSKFLLRELESPATII